MTSDLKSAPDALREQMTAEVAEWVTKHGAWQSNKRIAITAVVEWRLQEMGYTLWPTEGSTE